MRASHGQVGCHPRIRLCRGFWDGFSLDRIVGRRSNRARLSTQTFSPHPIFSAGPNVYEVAQWLSLSLSHRLYGEMCLLPRTSTKDVSKEIALHSIIVHECPPFPYE